MFGYRFIIGVFSDFDVVKFVLMCNVLLLFFIDLIIENLIGVLVVVLSVCYS